MDETKIVVFNVGKAVDTKTKEEKPMIQASVYSQNMPAEAYLLASFLISPQRLFSLIPLIIKVIRENPKAFEGVKMPEEKDFNSLADWFKENK